MVSGWFFLTEVLPHDLAFALKSQHWKTCCPRHDLIKTLSVLVTHLCCLGIDIKQNKPIISGLGFTDLQFQLVVIPGGLIHLICHCAVTTEVAVLSSSRLSSSNVTYHPNVFPGGQDWQQCWKHNSVQKSASFLFLPVYFTLCIYFFKKIAEFSGNRL